MIGFMEMVFTLFREYWGDLLPLMVYAIAFVFLFVTEKEKNKRILLLYLTAVVLVLFFFPLFAKVIIDVMEDEIYYRILWILPVTVTVAYAGVRLVQMCKPLWGKAIAVVLLLVTLAGCGDYVYDNPYFSVATNRFHLPDEVIVICDSISVPGREVRAVFPSNLLSYVREYTAAVCMPYGREAVVERWNFDIPLFDAMEEETIDAAKLGTLAYEAQCHYIILNSAKPINGDLADYTYRKVNSVGVYDIYLSDDAYLGYDYNHEGF